jgi:Leucine-rich repeat (LRR) protein
LSQNLISSTFDSLHPGKLYVEEHLNLSMNQVHTLVAKSFQSFYLATSVTLSYNPIIVVEDGAFLGANTQQLDLSHNYIQVCIKWQTIINHYSQKWLWQGVYPAAFRGLERSFKKLNLGFNNLTYLPPDLFAGFVALQELVLDENAVSVAKESLLQLASLNRLSIVGNKVLFAPFEELSALSSLRELNVSNLPSGSLTPQLFTGFGTALQHLKISYANVSTL